MSETYEALLARLASAIATLHTDRRIRVAIDGVDGAGKTVMADALAPLVIAKGRQVIRASVDDFHHPRAATRAAAIRPMASSSIPTTMRRFGACCLIRWGLQVRATTSQGISIIAPTSPSRDGRNSHHQPQH